MRVMGSRGVRACVLGIGIIAVLALFVLWLHSPDGPVDLTGQSEVTVTLTSSGFVPQDLYVSRNTKVTFRSTVARQFWPASNLHPFHTIYPAFDPKRPLDPNETWSFVFDKDGRWNYHDHMNPVVTGSIIVVPEGDKGNARFDVLAPCDQQDYSGRQACWEEHISFAMDQHGVDAAFDELRTLYQAYSEVAVNCHNYAHDLGLLAYIRYGDSVPLDYKAVYCGQGFYHGFMEGFLSTHKGDVHSASAYCDRVTAAFSSGEYAILGPQCMHGIGHGYMEYLLSTRADLISDPVKLVSLAMSGCAVLPDDDTRFRCASGAYAVLKDWINLQHIAGNYVKYFSAQEPYALCRAVSEPWAQSACAWELSKEALVLNNYEPGATFKVEKRAGGEWMPKLLPSMYESTAFLIGERGVSLPDKTLIQSCATVSDLDLRAACLRGIVEGIMFNADPENELGRSSSFCRSSALNEAERAACIRSVIGFMSRSYGPAKKAEACIVFSDILRNSTLCI